MRIASARVYNPTLRDIEILLALVRWGNNKEAAAELGVRAATVKTHIGRMCTRYGLDNRTQLVLFLWPILADALPAFPKRDRRLGYERRHSVRNSTLGPA